MASPPASVGRRRGVGKQLSTEDHALNMIAREAEARLAAKRAARAEARSIRMKELEKAQKEADEQMDRDYELNSEDVSSKKRTIAASRLTSGLIPDDDREVSENISDAQLTQLKDNVRDLDGKYRKAMVSIAQLDNERQALQYQVECLKDQVEDMDESREDLKDELMHKVREYNKLSRDHAETLAELEEMRLVIQHRESLLEEHGINLDGTVKQRDEPDASEPEHGSLHNFVSNHVDSSLVEDAFANEREKLLSEIHTLKEEVALLRASVEPGKEKNANHESLRRELQKQLGDAKSAVQRLEQENARLEGQVIRLESQVKRYKQQADNAESVEDGLLAEKRKLAKQLRLAQEQIMELENEQEALQKRYDRLRQKNN